MEDDVWVYLDTNIIISLVEALDGDGDLLRNPLAGPIDSDWLPLDSSSTATGGDGSVGTW